MAEQLRRPGVTGVGGAGESRPDDARPVPGAAAIGTGEHAEAVTVALAQIAPRLGDLPSNLARHLELVAEARAAGAQLLVFPELSLTGYFLKDLVPEVALRPDAPAIEALMSVCQGIDVVVGCVLESDDARFANAALYFTGGRVHAVHRKVYLPTYGLFDEQRYLAAGDRFRAFEAPGTGDRGRRPWRAGILVCEDMWHPSAPAILARDGVDMFLCPSASPGRGVVSGAVLGTARSYEAMTTVYAELFTAYLIYCNRVGWGGGGAIWGDRRVVGPDGRVLGEPAGDAEVLAIHRIDLAAIRRARIANPLLRDERNDVNDAEAARLRSRRALD